jgi:hypothetical protein
MHLARNVAELMVLIACFQPFLGETDLRAIIDIDNYFNFYINAL